jgi:hypothetical protein
MCDWGNTVLDSACYFQCTLKVLYLLMVVWLSKCVRGLKQREWCMNNPGWSAIVLLFEGSETLPVTPAICRSAALYVWREGFLCTNLLAVALARCGHHIQRREINITIMRQTFSAIDCNRWRSCSINITLAILSLSLPDTQGFFSCFVDRVSRYMRVMEPA